MYITGPSSIVVLRVLIASVSMVSIYNVYIYIHIAKNYFYFYLLLLLSERRDLTLFPFLGWFYLFNEDTKNCNPPWGYLGTKQEELPGRC